MSTAQEVSQVLLVIVSQTKTKIFFKKERDREMGNKSEESPGNCTEWTEANSIPKVAYYMIPLVAHFDMTW